MRHVIITILLLSLLATGTALGGIGDDPDCEGKGLGAPCMGSASTGVCTHVEYCRELLKRGKNGERVGEWLGCARCLPRCHKKSIGDECILGRWSTGVCTKTGTELITDRVLDAVHERLQDKITCESAPLRYYLQRPKFYLPAVGITLGLIGGIVLVRRRSAATS